MVAAAALSGGLLLAYVLAVLAGVGERPLFETWVYDVALAAAALACLLRGALVPAQRLRWLLVCAALVAWLAGDVYWDAVVKGDLSPPWPAPADAGYLAFYPLLAAAVLVDLRSPQRRLRATLALDALAAALTAGALGAALLYPALRSAADGSAGAVATNLAYPLADIVLIALTAARLSVSGARPRGPWLALLCGLACFVAADIAYLDLVARDVYRPGGAFDGLWLAAAALFALGALLGEREPTAQVRSGWLLGVASVLFALVATTVQTIDHFHRTNHVTLALSTATLVVVAGRLLLTFTDNARLLRARERDLAARERDLLTDPLTGLPNRRALAEALRRELASAERRGGSTGVLMLDVDNFKYVNDTLGHRAGDRLIIAVGATLSDELRDGDVLARVGGDEFAVLLSDADEAGAVRCARRLTSALRDGHLLAAAPRGQVTASIGVAIVHAGDAPSWEQALARADAAMYAAKEAGRDGYSLHADGASSQEVLAERFGWSARIRQALARDEFVLHAQPVFDVATGALHGRELLVRLRDPDGRLWLPGAFLPEAERFGLMTGIDRWVLRRAVALAACSDGAVMVNVSPASINDAETRRFMIDLVRASDLPAGRLVIEVTEHAAMNNLQAAQAFTTELKRLGCELALDDFGVAFASFFHLKHLPFDLIKIDGSFIRDITSDRTDQVLVGAIVAAAGKLGKRTLAEHVADDDAMALVHRLGVDFAQGFHLGRPEPIDAGVPA